MDMDEVLQHQVTLRFTDASRLCVTNMQCDIQANVLRDGSERLKLTSEWHWFAFNLLCQTENTLLLLCTCD